jgi:hypothetical protein
VGGGPGGGAGRGRLPKKKHPSVSRTKNKLSLLTLLKWWLTPLLPLSLSHESETKFASFILESLVFFQVERFDTPSLNLKKPFAKKQLCTKETTYNLLLKVGFFCVCSQNTKISGHDPF